MRHLIVTLGLVLGMVSTLAAEDDPNNQVRVGFRTDAPPFSFEDPDAPGQFTGFLAQLCYQVLRQAGLSITPVVVNAGDRFEQLSKGGRNDGVDILCEPASIQRKTMDNFLLSPILFVTGVGYLQKPRGQDEDMSPDVKVGYLRGTTAETAVKIAEERETIQAITDAKILREPVDNHWDGVEKVCKGELEYYFGDLDILRALRAKVDVPCDDVIDSNRLKFSYEAYALPISIERPDVAIAMQSGLYRAFSDGSAREIYANNFELERSDYLQALFAINGVLPCNGIIQDGDPCKP